MEAHMLARFRWILLLTVFSAAASASAHAQQVSDSESPEAAVSGTGAFTGGDIAPSLQAKIAGQPVQAEEWMIVAANPHAASAGARVLARGGTAADAVVATQAVLGLVEPQSSGLGGGAFLIWYDSASGNLVTLDGRETAPRDVTPRLFQDADGQPLKFFDAVVGGRSVGTPGTVRLLEVAQRRWGRLNWATLFDDAVHLAEDGFAVSPRLAGLIARDAERLARFEPTRVYFLPGGVPLTAGTTLENAAYATTLRTLATEGAYTFYRGAIARDIAATVQDAPGNPGTLTQRDLADYRVREREAVCIEYRAHDVCGMGPPSSGAIAVGQILGLLEPFDLRTKGPGDADTWRLIGDASRLAFADRGRYVADSDYVPVPTKGLLSRDYLDERAKLIAAGPALQSVAPGAPEFDHAMLFADDESIELPSTSHISIVDSYGNALSMTTTIENAFGSRLMVRGFLLNNELTDFSFRTHADGRPIANRVEPGKRPRSSMAPTIVLKDGLPAFVLGSPGGSRIIGYVAQTVIGLIDWGMDAQAAVAMPHLVNRFGTYDLEKGTTAEDRQSALAGLGYETNVRDLNSGLHVIAIGARGLEGGADPRREGVAIGN
jgi:gamma-glutamyltranspeptidase/glutathione hydrolase